MEVFSARSTYFWKSMGATGQIMQKESMER